MEGIARRSRAGRLRRRCALLGVEVASERRPRVRASLLPSAAPGVLTDHQGGAALTALPELPQTACDAAALPDLPPRVKLRRAAGRMRRQAPWSERLRLVKMLCRTGQR